MRRRMSMKMIRRRVRRRSGKRKIQVDSQILRRINKFPI